MRLNGCCAVGGFSATGGSGAGRVSVGGTGAAWKGGTRPSAARFAAVASFSADCRAPPLSCAAGLLDSVCFTGTVTSLSDYKFSEAWSIGKSQKELVTKLN